MTLILSNEDVDKVLTMPDCIDILEDAYRDLHAGTALTRRRSDCLLLSGDCSHHGLFMASRPWMESFPGRGSAPYG